MKQGIGFEISTTSFNHAVEVCEVAFGFKGESWEEIKISKDMDLLKSYLKSHNIDYQLFELSL